MLRISLVLPVLLGAVGMFAGCGDDGENGTAVPTATSPATVTVSVTPAPVTDPCGSHQSLEGQPLVAGVAFALDADQMWQLCNGGAAAGSSEKWLFHSADGGANWTLISRTTLGDPPKEPGVGDLPNGNGVVGMLFVDPNVGFLGMNSPGANLWRSSDGGVSWIASDALPPAEAVQSMSLAGSEPTVVTSSGTLVTTDNGEHWSNP